MTSQSLTKSTSDDNPFKMVRFSFVGLVISYVFIQASVFASSDCPQPNDQSHYVITALRKEKTGSDAGKLRIFYQLLRPYDRSKPTLLVINGGPGGDHTIIDVFRGTTLDQKMNIVGFDHRGVSCTKILSNEEDPNYEPFIFSMERAAADIEVIRHDLLGDAGWFVYSVSYGTMLAQQYAIKYPSAIHALILDSAMHESTALNFVRENYKRMFIDENAEVKRMYEELASRYPILFNDFIRKIRVFAYTYKGRIQKIPAFYRSLLDAPDAEAVEKILASVIDVAPPLVGVLRRIMCEEIWDYPDPSEKDEVSFFWILSRECPSFKAHRKPMAFSEALKTLPVKTLIWGGDYDPATPIQAMQEMHQLIPNSLFWENKYAGHALLFEKRDCAIRIAYEMFVSQSKKAVQDLIDSPDCQSPPSMAEEERTFWSYSWLKTPLL